MGTLYIQKTIKETNTGNAHKKSKLIMEPKLSDVLENRPFSVPQGTVLSPTLYNIYVSNLHKLALHGKLTSFADDTVLVVRGDSWEDVFKHIQEDMKIVKKWFQDHNLSLNIEKTKMIPFSINKTNLPNLTNIKIHESPACADTCTYGSVELVKSARYLGLELSKD